MSNYYKKRREKINYLFISDVCLLRLDFQMFDILGTGGTSVANEGDCLDTFTVDNVGAADLHPRCAGSVRTLMTILFLLFGAAQHQPGGACHMRNE